MPTVPAQSFPHSRQRAWAALSAGASLIAAGLSATTSRSMVVVGWVTVASGVGILAALLLPLWLRVPVVAFDDAGLRARLPGFGTVAWSDIERVRLVRLGDRGMSLLVVERTRAARRRRRGGRWPRSYSRLAGVDDLAVPIDGLTADPARIVACVQLAHRHATGGLVAEGGP